MTVRLSHRLTPGTELAMLTELGVAVLLLWAAAGAWAQTPERLDQDPLAGSEAFESKGCVKCHSVNGLGGTSASDLGQISRRRSFFELGATLWNHAPLMGSGMRHDDVEFVEMSAEEAGDLIGFLFFLHYFDTPGNVEVGKRLFNEKKCSTCHKIGNYGGDVGPDLNFVGDYGSPILVAAAMWNHSIGMGEAMEERGVIRPTFTETELIDLIAYLESAAPQPIEGRVYVLPGRAEAGRTLFVEKRCERCHAVEGVGGRVGPDLAKTGRQWSITQFAAAMWNKAPAMLKAMADQRVMTPQIGGGEMADLLAYLYSIKYFAEPGDADVGQQLLWDKGCLTCHGLAGAGAQAASDLARPRGMESGAAVIASLWNHAVSMAEGTQGRGGDWPVLSAEELASIASFLLLMEGSR
ncbi:MAG: c-type cytochrome [Gemmatimonadota bacterium]|nr:MAG: c-type cytochrome [Gemmatimonadota bacterium]